MLFVAPWIALMVLCVLAVPIAAKLSPSASYASADDAPVAEEEYADVPEDVGAIDGFDAAPIEAEAAGDDAFAEFG